MSQQIKPSQEAPYSTEVINALRLGWTLSELLGRIRKGARPPAPRDYDPDYAPRLTAGHGTHESSSTGFIFTALRLLAFSTALSVKCEDDPELQEHIEAFPTSLERWLAREQDYFNTSAQLRQLLEHWSLRVWAQLNTRSDAAVLAFTLGISLADTYWYLRKPAQRPKQCPPDEDWRRLLSVYRLDVARDRLETLRPALPAYLVTILQSHLNHWSIGTELLRDSNNNLKRLPFPFRLSHPLGIFTWRIDPEKWNQKGWRFKLIHPLGFFSLFRRPYQSPVLNAEEEITLQDNLERQAEIWRSLIFGLRAPTTYLHRGDFLWIRLITWTSVIVILVIVGWVLRWSVIHLGPPVVAFLKPVVGRISLIVTDFLRQPEGGLKEWVAVAVQVIPILAGLGVLLVGSARTATQLYQRWNDRVTAWFIVRRRTLVSWDRDLRSDRLSS